MPAKSAHSVTKHRVEWLFLVITLLAAGLVVSALAITLPRAGTPQADRVVAVEQNTLRGNAADAARYGAAAALCAARDAVQRSNAASTARFNAMAVRYAASGQ